MSTVYGIRPPFSAAYAACAATTSSACTGMFLSARGGRFPAFMSAFHTKHSCAVSVLTTPEATRTQCTHKDSQTRALHQNLGACPSIDCSAYIGNANTASQPLPTHGAWKQYDEGHQDLAHSRKRTSSRWNFALRPHHVQTQTADLPVASTLPFVPYRLVQRPVMLLVPLSSSLSRPPSSPWQLAAF